MDTPNADSEDKAKTEAAPQDKKEETEKVASDPADAQNSSKELGSPEEQAVEDAKMEDATSDKKEEAGDTPAAGKDEEEKASASEPEKMESEGKDKDKDDSSNKDITSAEKGGETGYESDKDTSEAPTTPKDPSAKESSADPSSSGKRVRKSIESYNPGNFEVSSNKKKKTSDEPHTPAGRGSVLGSIPGVEDAMRKSTSKNAATLSVAHRFIFGGRGKMQVVAGAKKQEVLLRNVLKFKGYLPPVPPEKEGDEDNAKEIARFEKMEGEEEDKMSGRAAKLSKSTLVDLCNFFDVDRTVDAGESPLDKEGVVNRLLDFLAEPDEELTKTFSRPKKASRSPKAGGSAKKGKAKGKRKSTSVAEVVDSDDTATDSDAEAELDSDYEGDNGGSPKKKGKSPLKEGKKIKKKMPTDSKIKKWVKAYVACFNLNKATTNHAIETCSEKFGIDVTPKKEVLKKYLTEEIYDHMNL